MWFLDELLEGLGDIKASFKVHVIRINVNGEEVEIKGDPSLSRTVAKATLKELKRGNEAYYVELGMLTLYDLDLQRTVEGLEGVLEEYAELFQEAIELPPTRRCNHAVEIRAGSQIPYIRPYSYPHHQKEE